MKSNTYIVYIYNSCKLQDFVRSFMHNKEAIEKKYFEQISPGHYIDVQTADAQWKMAKIIDKDKRYLYVSYDGWMNKEDQFFINSYRVAPLRLHSEGYTGSVMRVWRNNMPKIEDLKHYLEIAHQKCLKQQKFQAFEITQLLRGQLFVYVHDLLCKQISLNQEQILEINKLLLQLIDFIIKILQKVLAYSQQYLGYVINKLSYLSNPKTALIQSVQELLYLLNYLLKTQDFKYITIFKWNKAIIRQDKLAEYFMEKRGVTKLYQLFMLNDKNGRWLNPNTRKLIYKIMLKYVKAASGFVMPPLPIYFAKDFQEFYSIQPFMIKNSSEPAFQNQFVTFSLNILLTNSSFDAKLKAIQQIKKCIQLKSNFQFLEKQKILTKIDQSGVLEQLLDNKNFNPQVFKRFVPILSALCKVKSLSLKHIHELFEIVKSRHESQTQMIFQIIGQISQFAPSTLLDNVYSQICKIDINSQQTMKFIKTFTIKAIQNLSKEKSYFSGWFGKKKGSSKHGYFGLNLLWKQSADDGLIDKENVLFALTIIKEILEQQLFTDQKWTYINNCIDSIKKKKNFGQSLKLIFLILSTFEEQSFFAENKKKAVQKLQIKYNLIELIVDAFKSVDKISQIKMTHQQSLKCFYQIVEIFSYYLKNPLKVKQIQYLWYKCDSNYLLSFLKKTKIIDKKAVKLISSDTIQQIFKVIFSKPSFYKRNLTFREFQVIYELFIFLHLERENITIQTKDGVIRSNKSNLLGTDYFMNFLQFSNFNQDFQKAVKKTIQIIVRPSLNKQVSIQTNIQQKICLWAQFFKYSIGKLKDQPIKCLKLIQTFYNSIQGRLYKQIQSSDSSNIQILVEYEQQQKLISIERFSTIFRLRKLIKQKFKLKYDFYMFNIKLNKSISFQEQQDFSVNAMPTVDNGRSVSIKLELKSNKLHQQQLSTQMFKKLIENQEKLYQTIFHIIQNQNVDQNIEQMFWKTIQLLPLNKKMMSQVQKCQNFNMKKWSEYINTISENSLQYKLNIILSLMKQSQKWIHKMFQTQALSSFIQLLIKKLQLWSFKIQNQTLLIKLMKIILRFYQKCDNKKFDHKLIIIFNSKINQILKNLSKQKQHIDQIVQKQQQKSIQNDISIDLVNKCYQIYLYNMKLINQQENNNKIKLCQFIRIIDYGLYQKKNVFSQRFSQQIIVSVTFAMFNSYKQRQIILLHLIKSLNLNFLYEKQRCQSFFKFMVTILYSFDQDKQQVKQTNKQNNMIINQQKHIQVNRNCIKRQQYDQIWNFIILIIRQKQLKDKKVKQADQILHGSLSLLKYMITRYQKDENDYKIDLKDIFKKLVDYFLFPISHQYSKRLKTEKNKKLIFQIMKKIIFINNQLAIQIINKIKPFLQNNKYRKNSMLNWNLHFQNSQKNHFVGLQNLGATCYINCLFQQLFMIKNFRQKFIQIDSRQFKEKTQSNQIYQLQNLFYTLKYSERRSQSSKKFCQSFITFEGEPINPMIQSDADQFLNTLMQRIQTFLKQTNRHQILQTTFEGKLSNQLICQGCPHKSQKIQSFMSIGVNLKNKKTLEQALKGYVQGQILDGDNAYYCQPCQKKVRTLKRLCIKQLPNILVIVLKRFQYDYDAYKKIKINSFLEFPQKLDMTQYTSDYLQGLKYQENIEQMEKQSHNQNISKNNQSMNKYQQSMNKHNQNLSKHNQNPNKNNIFHLRGSVIHAGTGDAGHYYSFIKQNQKWYEFNDDFIEQINYSKIQEQGFGGDQKSSDDFKMEKYKNAYILFYQRQSFNDYDNDRNNTQKNQTNQTFIKTQQNQKKYQSSQKQFYEIMKTNVIDQNFEANIFSFLLEPQFIHFWQNLSILDNIQIQKFLFLFYHTVILRDKMRYDHQTDYLRILMSFLQKKNIIKKIEGQQKQCQQNIAEWYLAQIDNFYVKQFLIQAPKTSRFICVSLILTAIQNSIVLPKQLPMILLSCLRRTGMSPFALVIKQLSHNSQVLTKLIELNFKQIIYTLVTTQTLIQNLNLPKINNIKQSYFGKDGSENQIEKEKCSAALIESLQMFQLAESQIHRLNQGFSFRRANQIIMKKLAIIYQQGLLTGTKTSQDLTLLIKLFQDKIVKSGSAKDYVQKYFFLLRNLIIQKTQPNITLIIQKIVCKSFQNFIKASKTSNQLIDWSVRQLSKIAKTQAKFIKPWRATISDNLILSQIIESWLATIQKLHVLHNKQQIFAYTKQMQTTQKIQYFKNYSKQMKSKTKWMFESETEPQAQYESDFQNVKENDFIKVRNSTFKIREKFTNAIIQQVSYLHKQDHRVWAYLEKNQIEIFNNL